MQTFLPYANFDDTMRSLDLKRLSNQVHNEGIVLLHDLGWHHHPANKMWRGYERCLAEYLLAGCRELERRGYDAEGTAVECRWFRRLELKVPPWLGRLSIHDSHKAMLFHKDPEYYHKFASHSHIGDYVWPSCQECETTNTVTKFDMHM